MPPRQPKRGRLWLADGSCVRLRPERPNHVWSYDFVEDRTHDGRRFRMRWSPSVGQLGGLGKLGPGFRQAANLVTASAPYASSGVLPSRPEWGRLVL